MKILFLYISDAIILKCIKAIQEGDTNVMAWDLNLRGGRVALEDRMSKNEQILRNLNAHNKFSV